MTNQTHRWYAEILLIIDVGFLLRKTTSQIDHSDSLHLLEKSLVAKSKICRAGTEHRIASAKLQKNDQLGLLSLRLGLGMVRLSKVKSN